MTDAAADNFHRALRRILEETLICSKCGAMNRPGATIIELTGAAAVCAVCAHSWPVDLRVDPR